MTDELKPCPFCGGEAEIVEAAEVGPQSYVVCCRGCMCSSKVVTFLMDDATQDLVDAWNTRPTVRPAVKALDWRIREDHFRADTPSGVYTVGDAGGGLAIVRLADGCSLRCTFDEAKNVCEWHYLSCLEDTPADPWQPIETAPKDGYFFEAWHVIHKCWVSVKFLDTPWNGCELIEKTMTSAWPLAAFSYWKRSTPPPQEKTDE